jgi:enoyl-CoA hydratase
LVAAAADRLRQRRRNALHGRTFRCPPCHQIGFVTHLATEGTDIDTAVGIGEKIAVNAPFAVAQTKNLLNTALGIEELRQHMTTEIRTQVLCSLTGDAGEGVSAALQRRTPTFSNS